MIGSDLRLRRRATRRSDALDGRASHHRKRQRSDHRRDQHAAIEASISVSDIHGDQLDSEHVQSADQSEKIGLKPILIYSQAQTGLNLCVTLIGLHLLYFYTDRRGLSPALAGLAFFIALVLDALTDPIVGNISDRARFKAGRRRPFFLAAIPMAAVLFPATLAARTARGFVRMVPGILFPDAHRAEIIRDRVWRIDARVDARLRRTHETIHLSPVVCDRRRYQRRVAPVSRVVSVRERNRLQSDRRSMRDRRSGRRYGAVPRSAGARGVLDQGNFAADGIDESSDVESALRHPARRHQLGRDGDQHPDRADSIPRQVLVSRRRRGGPMAHHVFRGVAGVVSVLVQDHGTRSKRSRPS